MCVFEKPDRVQVYLAVFGAQSVLRSERNLPLGMSSKIKTSFRLGMLSRCHCRCQRKTEGTKIM